MDQLDRNRGSVSIFKPSDMTELAAWGARCCCCCSRSCSVGAAAQGSSRAPVQGRVQGCSLGVLGWLPRLQRAFGELRPQEQLWAGLRPGWESHSPEMGLGPPARPPPVQGAAGAWRHMRTTFSSETASLWF